MVEETRVLQASFRTNHAPSYLDVNGTLPDDKDYILAVVDRMLAGEKVPALQPQDLLPL